MTLKLLMVQEILIFGKSDDNDNRFEVIEEVSSVSISNDSAFSSGTDPQFGTWLLVKKLLPMIIRQ